MMAKSLRTPLGKARGLGSAKSGLHHWWAQRISAVALVPLAIWLVVSLLAMHGQPHADVADFVSRPWNAIGLIALLLALFYHLQLGVQVVIEDYVHQRWLEVTLLITIKLLAVLATIVGIWSILITALGGANG